MSRLRSELHRSRSQPRPCSTTGLRCSSGTPPVLLLWASSLLCSAVLCAALPRAFLRRSKQSSRGCYRAWEGWEGNWVTLSLCNFVNKQYFTTLSFAQQVLYIMHFCLHHYLKVWNLSKSQSMKCKMTSSAVECSECQKVLLSELFLPAPKGEEVALHRCPGTRSKEESRSREESR